MSTVEVERQFETMYRLAYPAVLRYCRRRLPEDAARDAAADVFLVAWRRFGQVPEPALPWLIRTASLTVRTGFRTEDRSQRLTARIATVDAPAVVPDHAEAVAQGLRVREALAQLPEQDRELLQLTSWDDVDAATAAAVLGCSRATVRVRLHRARKRLAALLDAQPPDDEATRTPHATAQPVPHPVVPHPVVPHPVVPHPVPHPTPRPLSVACPEERP